MPSDGERIATLEAIIHELRDDISDVKAEVLRSRARLHDLEGATGLLVDTEKVRARDQRDRQRRLEIRLQALTIAVAIAAFAEPFLYSLANH